MSLAMASPLTPSPASPSPSAAAATVSPPPLSPTVTTAGGGGGGGGGGGVKKKSRARHVWRPMERFEVKSLRVAGMLSTQVISVEDMGSHDSYVILVHCGDAISWQIRRRYSEFYSFKRRMSAAVAAASRAYAPLPEKVIFKRDERVTAHRRVALDSFLRECLERCSAYGTEEQDLIFRFLSAYENIIHTVELDPEALSVMESLGGGGGGVGRATGGG
jgi:hypothetical protein